VEVMVASCIVIFTYTALLLTFNISRKASYAAANYSEACNIASQELEFMLSCSYHSVTSFGPISITSGKMIWLGGKKHCEVIDFGTNGYKSVTITITWTNSASTEGAFLSLATIISRKE